MRRRLLLTLTRPEATSVTDAAGNTNQFGAFGEFVEWDVDGPEVTVEQAAGQVDPTGDSPILFTVEFSESVTGFAANDVQLGGTAGPTDVIVTGSNDTYTLAVSGMSQDGIVTASVKAGAVTDSLGNPSTASTSTDNSVEFKLGRLTIFS